MSVYAQKWCSRGNYVFLISVFPGVVEEQSKSSINVSRYSPHLAKLRVKTLSSESLKKAFQNPIQLERAPSPLVSNRMSDARTSSVFDDDTTLSESHGVCVCLCVFVCVRVFVCLCVYI